MTRAFKCPTCGAVPHKHGKGGREKCRNRAGDCDGLICECEEDPRAEEDDHGETLSNPCHNAVCYHCGFSGTVPKKPKGLLPWEKKALEEGWTPPEARRKELGLA